MLLPSLKFTARNKQSKQELKQMAIDELAAAMQVKADLLNLIKKAREQDKWIWFTYQDLWFTPFELEEQINKGKFLWCLINWKLRDHAELLKELNSQVDNLQDRIRSVISRNGEGR